MFFLVVAVVLKVTNLVHKNCGLARIYPGVIRCTSVGKRDYRTSGLTRISRGEGSHTRASQRGYRTLGFGRIKGEE